MKETNETEEWERRLRSWVPRRPSEGLRDRIFGKVQRAGIDGIHWGWGWMAPATAAIFLLATITQPPGSSVFPGGNGPIVATILSNQYVATYLPGTHQPHANAVPAETFEWTNGGSIPSSIPSLSVARGTN